MNKKALQWIADAIEDADLAEHGVGFNMGSFVLKYSENSPKYHPDHTGHHCGTVACIAGWTAFLLTKNGTPRSKPISIDYALRLNEASDEKDIPAHATKALGLTQEQANDLFLPSRISRWSAITAKQAVRTIRCLIETGVVDWHTRNPRKHLRGEYVWE